jgi:signal transduction histidine kinase/ActR/RegA family two-component response regulator
MKNKELILTGSFFLIFILIICSCPSILEAKSLKVGIYQNDPKVFTDKEGNPSGIFVDVLNEIARQENWELTYVYGKWSDHIESLKNGSIDILTDVAFSDEREQEFLFNKIEVIGSWFQVFTLNSEKIKLVSDLYGKKIGVLKGSIQEKYFNEDVKKSLEIEFESESFSDYEMLVKSLLDRKIDAIFVDRFFYFSSLRNKSISPTPVMFRPEGLFFAFSKTIDREIIADVDDILTKMKNDPDSQYYKTLYKWLGIKTESRIPDYVKWVIIAGIVLLVFFIIFSFLLKIEVRKKTEQALKEREMHIAAVLKTQKLESIGVLAGGIAHDFNNLLTGVYGYLDLAKMSYENSEKMYSYIESASKSLDRAKSLTTQLLTFSKGGAPVLKTEGIKDIILEVSQFAVSGSNSFCEYNIAENLKNTRIDKNQISQVIENIVINAVQAMPLGGKIVLNAENYELTYDHPVLSEGEYVRIEIMDEGTGIEEKIISKIFDPFFTTKKTGSGLGLAASYSILIKHKGYIDVQSEIGKGTVFRIYLPADNLNKISEDKQQKNIPTIGCGKVLVMEDDEIVRETICSMLEKIGFEAVLSSKGEETLEILNDHQKKGHPLNFIILNLTIKGGMGGSETIRKIREFNKSIPVFVFSGYADNEIMSEPVKHGFTASIPKPLKLLELSEIIKKHATKEN